MEHFYCLDLQKDDLSCIDNNYFDVIIFSHVIEHITNGLVVLEQLISKLKSGGRIYIEFPSIKSFSLPKAIGTLNFCDDQTHVKYYTLWDVINTLLSNGLTIIKAGRRRDWRRAIIGLLIIPYQIYPLLKHGKLHARGMWDLMGFADYVYAIKHDIDQYR